MNKQLYDREKAREGNSPRARLLRAKDKILQFTMEDIHKALEGDLPRDRYDQELMPLFLAYMEVTKKFNQEDDGEDVLDEGIEILKKLQAKAKELNIPTATPEAK